MNFFESQDAARRKTGRLVILFVLAVISIVISVYVVVSAALVFATKELRLWHPELALAVVAATALVVTFGSLYKIAQLRGGGRVVAESLGGRLLARDTQDPQQRKILNVVEEMAIASGTPVPPVYLLPAEKGINAFAAGYTPNDAVIGVTQGCIEQLSRSELQGVIAHEFSHIFNGDMRLNIRLIGVLNGILIIGIIGYFVLRSVAFSGAGRRRGGDKGGGAIVAIMGIGAGLAVVGFLGTLFGNLIKAAVSRQREYLADASAVQFTRDPGSIAGALKRIGGLENGSGVRTPGAVEASHMFFAKALTSGFTSLFATHPRLEDRIRRIDPHWDGTYPAPRTIRPPGPAHATDRAQGIDVTEVVTGAAILAGSAATGAGEMSSGEALSRIGSPSTEHVQYAHALIRSLPDPMVAAARETYGARAVIYALLLNPESEPRSAQMRLLERQADAGVLRLVQGLIPHVEQVAPEARLPLIDLATSALRELTPEQYDRFRHIVKSLTVADDQVSLFEWVLHRMVLRHLEPQFNRVHTAPVKYRGLGKLANPCAVLLSALSHAGHADAISAHAAFQKGADHLQLAGLEILDPERCGLEELDRSLDTLDAVSFKLKQRLLEAGVACVSADKQVTIREAELLRGIADALGCPMPPLLPGQRIA